MLIGFLGVACSGKTTLAARIFAELKELGINSEFIPELARYYIAEKKLFENTNNITLTDKDQFEILNRQYKTENMFINSLGTNGIVITDSTIFNTIAYFSETVFNDNLFNFNRYMNTYDLNRYNLLFYCPPVKMPVNTDPNRVHSAEQINRMSEGFLNKVKKLNPDLNIIELSGSTNTRYHLCLPEVLRKIGY